MEYGNDGISQKGDSGEAGIGGILERASAHARGVLESIQAIAGTTACKAVQINELKKFAIANECWIENVSLLGTFSDRGSENEVYINQDNRTVYKLNDFRYSDDNLSPFFERIDIHNLLFPDCAYELVGFADNQDGNICAVLSQSFIRSDREATIEEIAGALALMGFIPQDEGEYFTNGEIDIFDAVPNNVLHGIDGQMYFIDTILYRADSGGLETYRRLSPRSSKRSSQTPRTTK